MSGLKQAQEQLRNSWQALQRQWHKSALLWDDPVHWRFEREFWQDFERVVPAAMDEVEKLDEVITRARQNVK